MKVEVLHYLRDEGIDLVTGDMRALLALGKAGKKDFATITSYLEKWKENGYFNLATFNHEQLKDPQFEGRLWEARLLKSARSDGVHGYRIFYVRGQRPTTGQEVAILLMLWGKAGSETPPAILSQAWGLAREVFRLQDGNIFFRPPDGTGIH